MTETGLTSAPQPAREPAPSEAAPFEPALSEPALSEPGGPDPGGPDPGGPVPAGPSPRRGLRVLVQVVGFLAGIGMLGWCVSVAFKPENRRQLEQLREASAGQLLGLLGLSFATLIVNGLIFWVTLRPARRLRLADVEATNAIGTFLGYLPFKIGLLTRIAIHNRRDKLPLLTIGTWFATVAVGLFAALLPPAIAGLWRRKLDGPWMVATVLGLAVTYTAVVVGARLFAGERGMKRLRSLAKPIPPLGRFLASKAFLQLHAAFDMLAHRGCTAAGMGLRLTDLVILSSRFALASIVIGAPIPWEQSFLVASSYFFIGIFSPFGVLGTREAGTTGVVALFVAGGEEAGRAFAVVALLVSASEAIAYLTAAGIGVAWLRPDRLLRARREGERERTAK